MRSLVLTLGLACLAASCSSYKNHHVRAEGASNEHFKMFTELVGDWYVVDADGDPDPDALMLSYELTASGTVVVERVFPGKSYEMLTMYYMDGGNLMLTHYCSEGNQPTMIEVPTDSQRVVVFEFHSGTNMDASVSGHMHSAKFEFLDVDRIRSSWSYWKDGAETGVEVMDVARIEDHEESDA